ncbi:MAG: serine hydrolase [Bacillota bacterium]|nr:serine hydrolase [Bacillota bacterium]
MPRRGWLLLAAVLLLAGCAAVTERTGSTDGRARELTLPVLTAATTRPTTTTEMPTTTLPPTTTADPVLLWRNEVDAKLVAWMSEHHIRPEQIAVSYENLVTGMSYQHNAATLFGAASTIKVPMAMYCLDLVAEGALSREQEFPYDAATDYWGGAGSLQYSIQDGDRVALERLLELAIVESDNIATNMIFRWFAEMAPEPRPLRYLMEERYGLVYDAESSWGKLRPQEMHQVLVQLVTGRETKPHYATLLGWMERSSFKRHATRDLPVSAAHKYGWLGEERCDIGLVYAGRPYLFTIYSTGLAEPEERLPELGMLLYGLEN